MPWCPKCKNEYREGFTVCADCGCELVDQEPLTDMVPLLAGTKEVMTSLKKYLEYNKLQNVSMMFNARENMYMLMVKKEEQQKAVMMSKIFMEEESKRRMQEQQTQAPGIVLDAPKEQAEEKKPDRAQGVAASGSGRYHKSADRAEENRSSAWVLLGAGGIGLFAMALGIAGVLPFDIGNQYMFYGVMSALFLVFLVMGVVSLKNAKQFATKAESENSLKNTLTAWCRDNLTGESVDAELSGAKADPEEILYFKRSEIIKERLNRQFVNLDQAFLDQFIDEVVYDMVFSEETE
ncbi:MAG: hypothetical protein J6C84_02150 [Lachnospiraceae bacterium]|nr:hypothetical protein [Lachnospiraceae bacterium]